MTLAQETVESKSNEIPAVQKLVKELAIPGCMVVADALNCQIQTDEAIVEAKANYLLSAKGNQTEDITLYAQWCIEKFVHINELNVRASPSSEARSLTRLKQNKKILVISNNTSNPWVKIKYDGTTGYVNGTYLRDFNITEVLIGNVASGNRWLTEPSSDPYLKADNIRFLMTQVKLESLTDTIEAHFNIKIITPYGTIKRSNNSPAGYSYTWSINIADNGIYSLGGWENAYASSYERGKWRLEIWYANPANPANTNAMIASRSFYLK